MPFSFPWLKNPASTSTSNRSPSKPSTPNPFLPIQTHLTSFLSSLPFLRPIPPPWARIPSPSSSAAASAAALPVNEIEDRLAGVPVYALANSSQEFVLVSKTHGCGGVSGSAMPPPALGMLCFRREDADMLLAQMDGDMRTGSTVVPVALNKVIQLKSDGVAFRFLPDSFQVANAIKSRSLVLISDKKRYRPIFFRKEDLDNSLHRASLDQQKPNSVVRIGETQDSSSSEWDDAVFIPPGFDLDTISKPSHTNK